LFLHPDKKCGVLFKPEAGKAGPFAVRQQPTATVTGRILDADDRPIANAPLGLMTSIDDIPWSESWFHKDKEIKTDADGKFTIENLVEDVSYEIQWPQSSLTREEGRFTFTVKAGEKKDLGNLKHKPEPNE
jgi:hypothetical protein